MPRWCSTLLTLAFTAQAGCSKPSAPEQTRPRETRVAVEAVRLEPRLVEYAVRAVGSVEAFERIQISARVAGAVERAEFKEGDRVEKGSVLVEIEPRRFQLAVATAAAEVARATTARDEAEREQARAKKMVEEGVGSSMEASSWASRRETANAALSAAKAALGLAELNLRDARVRAPATGIIQSRSVQTGEHVTVGRVLATLVRRDPLLLRFELPEADARRIEPGMRAEFTVQGMPGRFGAKLTHVADATNPATRLVPVVGEIEAGDGLRPGSFCEVKIPVGAAAPALVVPEGAVRATARGFVAFILSGEKAHERKVTLGMRTDDGHVEILSGLAAADVLVTRGAESLREGAGVRLDTGAPAAESRVAPSGRPEGSSGP
jgi:membrane fusion protein (multidrug efflux system)/multidrug efflux system membrane fusion protein